MTLDRKSTAIFWFSAGVSAALMMSTNVASGIYPIYKQSGTLSAFQITEVFATYIAGLMPVLLVSSWIVSTFGLRIVIAVALVLASVGTATMASASTLMSFVLARVLQGIAVGLSTGNLAAAIVRFEPNNDHHRAALTTGLAMTIGGGSAPIGAAIVAERVAHPTYVPYLLVTMLLLLLIPGCFLLPSERQMTVSPITRPNIPEYVRNVFKRSAGAAFLSWSVTATFLSVVPVAVSAYLAPGDLLGPALSAGAILIISGITQSLSGRIMPERKLKVGYSVLILAAITLIVGEILGSVPLVLVSSIIGGIGHGLTFLGASRVLNVAIAGKVERAEVLAAYNVAIYCGVGLPPLCVGALSAIMSTTSAVCLFGTFVMLMAGYGMSHRATKTV
ncbi:MFS transporter [Nguyenibacter vanlangensis]|uniref:MFS transporter n=1 Tax=Nguyenibacter vanlangensis TaxID=1216886 RepID=A0A7Y7M3V4_9PROT|nr:MFS transporter [Nguyenibacter vanlangensis]NVN10075.1 MFS transporter [Nguyenibacter vanlangensis]